MRPVVALRLFREVRHPHRLKNRREAMRNLLTLESLIELAAFEGKPCLSLYQPTHRRHPENQQDPIRFRHLVKQLKLSLEQAHPAAEVRRLLKPFNGLAKDREFWNHVLDGLAVLGGADLFRVFLLQRPVRELAVVADTFHTKPLRQFLQTADRYQVLGLSRDRVRLYEGDRNSLDELELAPGVPRTIDDARADALGAQFDDAQSTAAWYGGAGGSSIPLHEGHGEKTQEADNDEVRFFRAVDRAVFEHHSRRSGLPLILAALPEHHHLFRRVSHNPHLLDAGLPFNPEGMAIEEFRERAWLLVEPRYRAQQSKWVDEFAEAKSKGLGSDVLSRVAEAAAAGRVATMLIESGRQLPGRIDRATGGVEAANLGDPDVDDLLDDLGELVVSKGGRVVVLAADRMPASTGLAATFRY
jgi:hypothetical protein